MDVVQQPIMAQAQPVQQQQFNKQQPQVMHAMPAQVILTQQANTHPFPQGASLIEKYGDQMFQCDLGCCYGLWCYPCAMGKVAGFALARHGQPDDQGQCCMYCCGYICAAFCCGPFATFLGCSARQSLETKLAHTNPGMLINNNLSDCCCHLFCPCFAIGQELRAIENFKLANSGGAGSPEIAEMER